MVSDRMSAIRRVRPTAERVSGDLAAPVHSFAAALFLPQEKIHNFYDMCVLAQTSLLVGRDPDADPRPPRNAAPTGTIRTKHVLVRFPESPLESLSRWVLTGSDMQKIASFSTTTASASATPKTRSTPTGSSPPFICREVSCVVEADFSELYCLTGIVVCGALMSTDILFR